MSRRALSLVLAASAIAASAGAQAAEPTLEVRARMRIQLEREEHTANGGLVISGLLVDESAGEPMPSWTVALRLTRLDVLGRETAVYSYAEPTDIEGGFRFEVPHLSRERHVLRLTAPGDTVYAAPLPVERTIDMSRRDLELRLHAPTEHPAASPALPIVLEAVPLDRDQAFVDSNRDRGLAVDVDIDGRAVATVLLKDGRASTALALPPSPAGRELVLHAAFRGDDAWGPAEAAVRVRIVEPAAIELVADRPRVTAGDEVALSGRLRVGTRPLGGVTVIVRRVAAPEDPGDAPFVAAKTEADGTFRASLRAPVRPGQASFEASFPAAEAKERGLLPATSELVVVDVAAGLSLALLERRPSGLALGILGALLAGLLAQRWLRRTRRALPEGPLPPTAAPPRKLFGTLRIARDRRVAGRVRDAERGRPLAGARLRLHPVGAAPGDAQTAITDADGAFAFREVADGAVELFAEADGHAPSGAAGHVPHRGELAALELSLMPLRGELLRRYDELLAPFVVGERLGRRTPRELAEAALRQPRPRAGVGAPADPTVLPREAVRALRRLEAVRALRRLVEERCFGDRPVGVEALAELEKLAEKIPAPPR